jgi:hypothetical protein
MHGRHNLPLPPPLPVLRRCLLIVLAYVTFFRLLGIFALRYINFLKR